MTAKQARPGDAPGPWCSICGRTVKPERRTWLAGVLVGQCVFSYPDGRTGGHANVPLITDHGKLLETMAAHTRQRQWKRHNQHLGAYPVQGCPICAELVAKYQQTETEGAPSGVQSRRG